MRVIQGIGNLVLVVMAAVSLAIMVAAYVVDLMVNGGLYNYGLYFNYDWYIPFKNVIGLIYALAWANIIIALGFQLYRIKTIRKDQMQGTD
jgi:hypothetical protein